MEAVRGAHHDDGMAGHQQVMSAQAQPTSQLNGTDGPRASGVTSGGEATGSAALRAEGTSAGHESLPAAEASQPREAPASSGFRPPVSLEATAAQGQVESMATPTIDDAGGRPATGIAAEVQGPTAAYDFFTPRSRSPGNGSQNNWFGRSMAENWPRWMNRLGSYLAVGQDPLAPSPLTGDTPPGGRSFMLRSPQRAARPLTIQRPSTPPSSSVPAEAIQQEVQRQLAGIRSLLEDSEHRNQLLQREIDELRGRQGVATGSPMLVPDLPRSAPLGVQGACGRLLGDLASAPSGPGDQASARRLLGDLASAPSGPGDQASARRLLGDLASAPSGPGDQASARRLLGDLASAPSGPGDQASARRLLGDLASAPSGPGDQASARRLLGDLASAPSGPGDQASARRLLGDLALAPSGQSAYPDPGGPVHNPTLGLGNARGDQGVGGALQPDLPPEPRGLLRSLLGGTRQRSQSPPNTSPAPQPESPILETIARGMQQLQQLQAQALAKGSGTGQPEGLKAGTTSLTQLPDHRGGAEASIRFNDWLEITTTAMTDVSERSGHWWEAVLLVVRAAYTRWLSATHLERLAIHPEGMDDLCGDPWSRMNARACTMLLGAMPQELKGDMVAQQLTQKAPAMLFRLFVWYQPGGSAERQEVLKRLQSPQDYLTGDTPEMVLAEVRSWPRWLSRCKMMGMTPPDPLVMSRGLQALTAKSINSSTDASFRTSMLRSTYRLDGQPTLEQVQGYQKHLQAELEGIVGAQRASGTSASGTALRAIETTSPTTSPKAPKPREKSQELCRYFAKPSGCKRGDKCVYNHSMSGMDKDLRARKCLKCGSESHRAKECQVGKPQQRSTNSTEKPPPPTTAPPSLATISTTASTSSALSGQGTVQGTPWTLETLIQAAQQVIHAQAPSDGDRSPEKTKAEVKVLSLRDVRISAMDRSTTALLDSGATHCLRNAHDDKEWLESEEVMVQLAGNNALTMKLSSGGSLMMPPRSKAQFSASDGSGGQTIVPLGELVKTLGYSLDWSQKGCFLIDPQGISRSLGMAGGCPLIQEAEALALISRLEDRKREMLENATVTTQDMVEASEKMMQRPWESYLTSYVREGSMEEGLRALRDSPILAELPGSCVDGLVQENVIRDGWKIFKEIEYLSRHQRRRLWTARKWVIHLFAGSPGHFQVYQLDEGDTVVVELDLQRNRGHDITRTSTWRLLLWAAMQGRIEAIIGGPPGRTGLGRIEKQGMEWDNKSLKVVTRMLWLYAVAMEGRIVSARGADRGRPVAFMMEHPPTERDGEDLGSRPRRRSVWETAMWKAFQEEYGMTEVTFDQRAMGAKGLLPTTLGTNIYYLQGLQGEGVGEQDYEDAKDYSGTWSAGFTKAVVMALQFWKKNPITTPRLCSMTQAQWKRHVDSNHLDYNRECLTCVLARGTGRRHARVHHPEMFSLTVDIAGPVKAGLDCTSKGTQGKGLRYLLVGKYTLPKEFVKAYSGRKPPDDDGLLNPLDVENTKANEKNKSEELGTPSLLPPREEGDQGGHSANKDNRSQELGTPSLLPPREEGDLFFDDDVPGEQGRIEEDDVPGEQGQDVESERMVVRPELVGATETQVHDLKDYECSEYEPSLPGEEGDDPEQGDLPLGSEVKEEGNIRPDCEAPEGTILLFAKALKTNAAMR